jgi:hypothetical protein
VLVSNKKFWFLGVCALAHTAAVTFSITPSLAQNQSELMAYPGEYVVTLPQRTERPRSEAALGAMALPGSLQEQATVLRMLDSQSLLVSTQRSSSIAAASARPLSALSAGLSEADRFCKDLISSRAAETCTPNYRLTIAQASGPDPLISQLWGLTDEFGVGAFRAWEITEGADDVVVAVIDTGVDYTHPDLAANMWSNPNETAANGVDDDGNGIVDDVHGANFHTPATSPGNPMDDNQHGTHVAGTIGAVNSNAIGVSGVSKRVKIMALKFMDASGSGRLSDAIAAIDYMTNTKLSGAANVRVANNSWGGGGYSPAMLAAIERARQAGIVFAAAAGNEGRDNDLFPSYPSSYEVSNVVSVAAIDRDQNLASFSNYGAESVDVAAPGVEILSTLPGGGYGALSGTSMATPHVVGSLALLFAVEPQLSAEEAIERILLSGRTLASLRSPDGAVGLVRSQRAVDAGRLVRNEQASLPSDGDGLPACGYTFQVADLLTGGSADVAADSAPIINQSDEGSFARVALPFDFPFFRTSTRVLYVSPNGVVYLNEPTTPDYQFASRAPNYSLAAFHSDLLARKASQGVRAKVTAEKVTITWISEHYSLASQGPVSVRLTLYPSGLAVSSVSFENGTDPAALSRIILGDAWANPPIAPLGLIGASAGSSKYSSTLNIADAQRSLTSISGQRLDLRVTMVPNCGSSTPPENELTVAKIDRIRLNLLNGGSSLRAMFFGTGSGKIVLTGSINRRACPQVGWATVENGAGQIRLKVPKGAQLISLQAPTDAKGVLRVRNQSRTVRRPRFKQMCAELMRRAAS